MRGLRIAWLFVLVAPAAFGEPAIAPAPVSETERAAVGLVLEAFERGPDAWWEALADDAPLADLGHDRAVAAIEVRTGPLPGARWTLATPSTSLPPGAVAFAVVLPTGVDDVVVLEMVEVEGAFRLLDLRSLVDPVDRDRGPVVVGLALLTVAIGFQLRPVALLLVVLLLSCREAPGSEPADEATDVRVPGLAELLPLRRALGGSGVSQETLDGLFARPLADPGARRVQRLWRAQRLVERGDLAAAESLLATLPAAPSPLPLEALVRARVAVLAGRADDAVQRYDEVLLAVDQDLLRLEKANAMARLGLSDASDVELAWLAQTGSRLAEVHFEAAKALAVEERLEEARLAFRTGWELQPLVRADVLGDPVLAYLCTNQELLPLLEVSSIEEPVGAEPTGVEDALALPHEGRAYRSGRFLALRVGESALDLPGAAALSPADTLVENARARADREEREALGLLQSRPTATVTGPHLRTAATAMARAERWDDLLGLTEPAESTAEVGDPIVLQLRALALTRTGRDDEALGLLVRLATTDLESHRRDPGVLFQLAELLRLQDETELAGRLLERADALAPGRPFRFHRRQVELLKKLLADNKIVRTKHFEIRYPASAGDDHPQVVGRVLEEEWTRLQRWIPVREDESIGVDLFPVRDFLESYSAGIMVLGLFDGRLRLPLADLQSLHPDLVAILSHELAHAMITALTDDRAPRWLQEGLAQHVEMVEGRINPIPDLLAANRALAFPLVEAALAGFANPQFVDLGYGQAAWTIHFVEARWGVSGIHRLLEAAAEGAGDEILDRALDRSAEDFDHDLWAWSVDEAPSVWPRELRRYDREARLARLREAPASPRAMVDRPDVRSSPDGLAAEMAAWYPLYRAGVRPFKDALGPVLGAYLRGERIELGPACAAVRSELQAVFGDSRRLAAPDENVARALVAAFKAYERMAAACRIGDHDRARRELDDAGRALGTAASRLEAYGLRP